VLRSPRFANEVRRVIRSMPSNPPVRGRAGLLECLRPLPSVSRQRPAIPVPARHGLELLFSLFGSVTGDREDLCPVSNAVDVMDSHGLAVEPQCHVPAVVLTVPSVR